VAAGRGVEEFLEALGLGKFASEERVDGHGEGKPLPRMTRMGRIFTDTIPMK
jgi:hypothetical protein